MRLSIKRSQNTGKPAKFSLFAKLELSPQERSALDRYGQLDALVHQSDKARAHGTLRANLQLTLKSLTEGKTIETSSLTDATEIEEAIRAACVNAHKYLAVASTFDGSEDVFDIP